MQWDPSHEFVVGFDLIVDFCKYERPSAVWKLIMHECTVLHCVFQVILKLSMMICLVHRIFLGAVWGIFGLLIPVTSNQVDQPHMPKLCSIQVSPASIINSKN